MPLASKWAWTMASGEACLSNGGVKNGLSNGEWEEWCKKLGSNEPSYFLRLGWWATQKCYLPKLG
jgi:hypothetical protein